MPKKCPPGVFCIENTTLLFLIDVLFEEISLEKDCLSRS